MTIFTDAATISGKTSVSASEISARIESATISSVSTLISADRGPYRDSDIIASVSSVDWFESAVKPSGYWGAFDDDNGII